MNGMLQINRLPFGYFGHTRIGRYAQGSCVQTLWHYVVVV